MGTRKAACIAWAAILLAAAGCRKEGTAEDPGGPAAATYTLNLTLDGSPVARTSATDIFVPGAMGNSNMDLTVCTSFQESVVSDSVDVNDRWKLGLIKTFYGLHSTPPPDSVNTMVALGPRTYGSFLLNPVTHQYDVTDGVRVDWTDPSGVKWSTDRGAADQVGSAFSIDERTSTGDPFGPRYTFKVTFRCKLYDGAGHSKQVTDGALFGPVITQ